MSDFIFKQIQGVSENIQDYYDEVALAAKHSTILFKEGIANPTDVQLIQTIVSELKTMNLANLEHEDISLCENLDTNIRVLKALATIIPQACKILNFKSESIRNNFIAKIMIWANMYLGEYKQSDEGKVLYFGFPKDHEYFFLYFLAKAGLEVTIYSPNQCTFFPPTIEATGLEVFQKDIKKDVTFAECIAKGVVVEKVTTFAKQATVELESTLYTDSGVYKPWQFSTATTKPILLDSAIEDVPIFWNEEARMRPGFKANNLEVSVPNFFTKISGIFSDKNEYFKLVETLKGAKYVRFFTTSQLSMVVKNLSNGEIYSLSYCITETGSCLNKLAESNKLPRVFQDLRSDTFKFVMGKLEEFVSPAKANIFNMDYTIKERIVTLATTLNIPTDFMDLVHNFDYPFQVPKVVIYVDDITPLQKSHAMILTFLNSLGLDIIVLNPAGTSDIDTYIKSAYYNDIRLEQFVRNFHLESPKKESFLKRLFR